MSDWKPDRVELYLDSKLVVEQMNGRFRVKSPELAPLFKHANDLLKQFPEVSISHVERAKNAGADALANQAIDAHVKKTKPAG